MIYKYTLLASVFAVLSFTSPARAQTMDVAMKIQAILDQFSEIRSGLKQIQSSLNIETMLGNLNGDFRETLKNVGGTIMDRNKKSSTEETSLLIVPSGAQSTLDNPDASAEWMRENMHPKKGATVDEIKDVRAQADTFQYIMAATAYGKAVATRKKLDTTMKNLEKVRQEAENTTAETDLQNQLNKLGLLKMEQLEITQMIKATNLQSENFNKTRASEINEGIQREK